MKKGSLFEEERVQPVGGDRQGGEAHRRRRGEMARRRRRMRERERERETGQIV